MCRACIKYKEKHECIGPEEYNKACGHCGISNQECCNLCGGDWETFTRCVFPCEWIVSTTGKRKAGFPWTHYMEICGDCDDEMVAKGLLTAFP